MLDENSKSYENSRSKFADVQEWQLLGRQKVTKTPDKIKCQAFEFVCRDWYLVWICPSRLATLWAPRENSL